MTGQEYEENLNKPIKVYGDTDVALAFEMGKKDALKDFHRKFGMAWRTVMCSDVGRDTIECELRALLEED